MSNRTITLTPHSDDRLGTVQVTVLQDLTAVCAGDLRKLEDGEKVHFERCGVTVERNGEEFSFTKG